jgi:tRNA-(ms[2]io[6]A)-hydroxylase
VIQSAPPAKSDKSDGGGSGADEEIEERPPWHWVGFGTIATFALWLPLAYLAEASRHYLFVSRFGASASQDEVRAAFAAMADLERFRWTATQTLPHLIAFALGAFAGGLLIGRFGTGTGPREAALSGVVTALVAVGVSWRVVAEGGIGALVSIALPLVIAVGFAWWGGRVGDKKARSPKPAG